MWYEDWFGRDEYELVYRERDEREAEALAGLVERLARPAPGAAVLDVACGRGRHARALARRGYRVTGVDLSARVLDAARRRTEAEGLAVRYVRGDMREPVCDACFDGVVNLFTAFGYFEAEADHGRAVVAMAAALRPGGWLVQDYLNAPHLAATLVPEDERRQGDLTIRQRRWIDDGRVNKEIRLHQNGHVRIFYESVRLLTRDDFEALYAAAGLVLHGAYGDDRGGPHTPGAPRLILYARKRA